MAVQLKDFAHGFLVLFFAEEDDNTCPISDHQMAKVQRELVQTMPESAAHIDSSPGSLGGSETILLVEDEQGLRRMACEVLTKHGHTVLEASCGEEALRVHEGYGKPANLLITDVIMPGMNGRELADRLQTLYPNMKVVFMSGHTEKAIMHHGILDTGILFIQKPFAPTTLLTKIRGILSAQDSFGEKFL